MAVTTNTKQPDESRLYDFDFTNLLVAGAALVSSPVPTMKQELNGQSTIDLTFGTLVVSSPKAQVRISGGTDGNTYKVSCVADDDAGNTLEVDGNLKLAD